MESLKGTLRLVRLALRRDRIILPLTMLIVIFLAGGGGSALEGAYPNYEEQLSYVAASAPSVVGRVFQGTVQDVSLGTVLMAEVFLFSAVIMSITSMLIVSRHTRHNEETGAGELIGSTVVGNNAPLSAALIVAVGSNIITAAIIYLFIGGMEQLDPAGSILMVSALAGVGIFFAGVSAITVQLSDYRRGANSMAMGALGAFFIIRAFGDSIGDLGTDGVSVTASWLSWLSPIGWGYQTLPYTQNRIMPLMLLLVGFVAATAIAFYLQSKRDVGSSIFETKPGPARAETSLLSASGLAKRLHKGGMIGWAVGFSVVGIVLGVMVNDFRQTFEENEIFQNLIASAGGGGNFAENTFAAMFPLMIGMLSGYIVSSAGKMSDEESSGRIEYLMGTAVGRLKWMASHLYVSFFGMLMNLFLMGLTAAVSYNIVADTTDVRFGDIVLSAMNALPAMLLFFAVTAIVFALIGRFVRSFAWFCYAYVALIGTLTAMFSWPDWLADLSPFNHVSPFPAATYNSTPAIVMSVLSIGLLLLAAWMFSRRDLSLK